MKFYQHVPFSQKLQSGLTSKFEPLQAPESPYFERNYPFRCDGHITENGEIGDYTHLHSECAVQISQHT